MRFRSIHGMAPAVGFREALLQGLAPDGSLYIPETLPRSNALNFDLGPTLHLPTVAAGVMTAFIDDLPATTVQHLAESAFSFPIPLVNLETDLYLLELFHGPTLAFKDVGARFMAHALAYFLEHEQRELTIAVATSGDTGSAVAHGFFNVPRISVFVLYPSGKISLLQEQQMTTLGGNIHAIEVGGTFDDCQHLVKRAMADSDLKRTRNLTTANSINVGRLIPQITYYVWGLLLLQKELGVFIRHEDNTAPIVSVPSGNFGNLTAAVYSKGIGAPIARFISATNANDVVPEYFRTELFRPRPSIQTFSNAMDVGNPSNFARLQAFYENNLDAMKRDIVALSITDQETLEEIRQTYDRTGHVLDPHTAVATAAARKHRTSHPSSRPTIVMSTAHPAKFPDVVTKALGISLPLPSQLEEAMRRPKQSTTIPADYARLRQLLLS